MAELRPGDCLRNEHFTAAVSASAWQREEGSRKILLSRGPG